MEYSGQYSVIKDSIYSNAHSEQIVKIGMEYAYNQERLADSIKAEEAKKTAALKLERQRIYTGIGIGGALLLAGFLFFMYRNYKLLAKEKQTSEKLLLNILPAEVADELKTTGSTAARHFDNVTVMLTDFANFTQAGERMSPQELIEELHACFKAFDEITRASCNIEKIKTIGDAYLAVAGIPVADDKHAEHVMIAARKIRDFMKVRREQMGDKTFEIRIRHT
ncbi:MAG: adenylate/guanylate cyclase domain-containing protein [Paludibaculum sp.]